MKMRLSDMVGMRMDKVPREAIPGLLGEVETLKARLWSRLMQLELQEKSMSFENMHNEIRGLMSPLMPKIKAPEPAKKAEPIVTSEGRIIRFKELKKIVGLSRPTIWRMMRDGRFPKSRSLSNRAVGWLDTEIYEWMGAERK